MIKNKKGFTLIEIMIAAAIVALIALIVIPAFKRAREKTRINTGISNLKTIYRAYQMYFSDTGKTPKSIAELTDYVKIDTSFTYELNPEYNGE